MYLLFQENHTANELISIGDGSYLKLITCEEGYYITENFKWLVDEQGWGYQQVDSITPYTSDPLA